jgi:outer membrane lipoprotein-sorting protein
MLSEKITSKGHFCFKKDNLLRWEYITPYTYIIVINKDKVLIKDETKLQKYDMNTNKVFKEINDVMMSCINGDILASKKFKIGYEENEKSYRLELTPLLKGMKESLKRIYMYFDKGVTSVVKLEMIEATDDFTVIDFSNKKVNGNIPIEKFILK